MRRRSASVAHGLVGLALAVTACSQGESTPSGALRRPVVVVPVVLRDIEERIEAIGELVARERAQIAAEVAGRVTTIRVPEGSKVEASTVVLEIDRERRRLDLASGRARLSEAEAALREEERALERVRTLHERKVASRARLDQAETSLALARSRLEAARASLGMAERALGDASVRAPFPGYVARRLVSRGEFVKIGTPLFELVGLDPIEVEFHLPEVDAGRVQVGQEAMVRVAPYPDEEFRASVSFVSPTIDPRTRTLRAKAILSNPEGRLRPGFFARTILGVAQRADIPTVPAEAILQRADGSVVFRLVDGARVERRVIRTGLHRKGWVEVVEGLRGTDRVVARGQADLVDGSVVRVVNEAPRSATQALSEAPRREETP